VELAVENIIGLAKIKRQRLALLFAEKNNNHNKIKGKNKH
jgi:hypothetical protein